MNNTKLVQLIRESINEYIREIDEAGNVAALEAKMNKTQEAIEHREKKMNMEGIDEAYHDMIDKGKMKELSSEVKALKKSLAKYEKQLDKLKNKADKSPKVEKEEEKEIVDEMEDPRYDTDDMEKNTDSDYEAAFRAMDDPDEDTLDSQLEEAKKKKKKAEKEPMNEQFLHMQKLAGLITEAEYKNKLDK